VPQEALANVCLELLVAGIGTTTSLIASAVLRLASDPGLTQRLRSGPAERVAAFVEETIRLDSPVQGVYRTAVRGAEVGGTRVPAGAHLLLLYAAANRDGRVLPNADALDLGRSSGTPGHLGFGHGPHRCPGSALGRAQGRIAVEEFLAAFESFTLLRPARELAWRPHLIEPGLRELPLSLVPAAAASRPPRSAPHRTNA
jgi:cytochrome P450